MPVDIDVTFEADAPQEEIDKKLIIFGNLLAQEMRRLAISMGLKSEKGGGDYTQGFLASVNDGKLTVQNRTKYAEYLEYGTYTYHDIHGLDTFPQVPDPKKKDLPAQERRRFPKGMQPFAVVRRVLFNQPLVDTLLKQVFS